MEHEKYAEDGLKCDTCEKTLDGHVASFYTCLACDHDRCLECCSEEQPDAQSAALDRAKRARERESGEGEGQDGEAEPPPAKRAKPKAFRKPSRAALKRAENAREKRGEGKKAAQRDKLKRAREARESRSASCTRAPKRRRPPSR